MPIYRKSTPISPDDAILLNRLANNIIFCLACSVFDADSFLEYMTSLCKMVFVDPPSIDKIMPIYKKIHDFCQVKKEIMSSDGKTQHMEEWTPGKLLESMTYKDYHSGQFNCKNCKGGKCSMGNPLDKSGNHEFSSSHHKYDSLSAHCVKAMIHTCIFAVDNSFDFDMIFKATLTALFHDVGKMQTINTFDFKSQIIVSYTAHGEAGNIMWNMLWCDEMNRFIEHREYMDIGIAIGRHMCGYHNPTGPSSDYKLDTLCVFNNQNVNILLSLLMVGDHEGKMPEIYKPFNEKDHEIFCDRTIGTKMSFLQYFIKYKLPHTIIFFLIGRSGAGKSTFAAILQSKFTVKVCSRDEAIAFVCLGIRKRLVGVEYKLMYDIYEAGKRLEKCKTPAEKQRVKQEIILKQTEWNNYISENELKYTPIKIYDIEEDFPNIPDLVKNEYNQNIIDALMSGVQFVIIDTYMNCFPQAIESILPKELSNYFRIHIHLNCTDLYTTTTLGGTIQNQLAVSGTMSINQVFHPDARNNTGFSSISTQNGEIQIGSDIFRAMLVFSCSRTGSTLFGIEAIIYIMKQFSEMYEIEPKPELESAVSVSVSVSEITETEKSYEGVDPKTMDMNFVELYKYILKQSNGNIQNAIKYINDMGFKCAPCLKKGDEDSFVQKLVELNNRWIESGITTRIITFEELKANQDLFALYSNCCLMFSYEERPGAKYWKNKWAKEMRGCCLFTNPETLDTTILNFKLPRGAEVAAGCVRKEGIETQDTGAKDITEILDIEQIDTCKCLSNNDIPIHGFLTSKADGSLLSITRYNGKALAIMCPIVDVFGSDYAKLWKDISLKLSRGTILLVPATHRTLIESGFMGPYMVTACLVGANIVNRKALKGLNYLTAWAKYGHEFIAKLLSMKVYEHLSDVHTFIFEAICKKRISAFDTHTHSELACSYNKDMLVFLGMSICAKRFYVPHMLYEREHEIPFDQPLWWEIKNSTEITNMIERMEDLIFKRITKQEYLTMFKPMNKIFDSDTAIIDYEGWVFMKIATFKIDDIDHLSVDIPMTIYSKIKTIAYYKSHKFKARNILYLTILGRIAGDIFPMANAVCQMMPDGVIGEMLVNICTDIRTLFNFEPGSELMNRLEVLNQKAISEGKKDSMSKFKSYPLKSKYGLTTSYHDPIIDGWIFDIFMCNIPSFEVEDKPSIIKIFRKLIHDLMIWEEDYETRIKTMNSTDPMFSDLIAIYFK